MEPFFQDLPGVSKAPKSSIFTVCRAAGLSRQQANALFCQGNIQALMSQSIARDKLVPMAFIYAMNHNIKIGFDRRHGVDIFFANVRNILTIDFDDNNRIGLTRNQWLKLLYVVATRKRLTFAVHETDRGLHAYCVSRTFSIFDVRTYWCMWALACDPQYTVCTLKQGWRIRLSPKRKSPQDFVCRPFSLSQVKNPQLVKRLTKQQQGSPTLLVGTRPVRARLMHTLDALIELSAYMVALYQKYEVLQTAPQGTVKPECQQEQFYVSLGQPPMSTRLMQDIPHILRTHHLPVLPLKAVGGFGKMHSLFTIFLASDNHVDSAQLLTDMDKIEVPPAFE